MRLVAAAAALVAALAAAAAPPQLEFPLDCTPDKDCWIQNYVDRDPGPGVQDYACGAMSYDGHNGTDIRVANRARMEQGVKVLAAAPGKVLGTRDGVADGGKEAHEPGRECGNGVRIGHGDGWVSIYCHLKRGSVRVRRGETVRAGQALGEVGLSGRTEFPHLHFGLTKEGRAVDPFNPGGGCGKEALLWKSALPYMGLRFFNSGFADGPAQRETAAAGGYESLALTPGAPALVFWFELAGVRPGDALSVTLRAPDGTVIAATEQTMTRTQAAVFRFVGKKRTAAAWPAGTYVGEATARREAETPTRQTVRREATIR
jgi:hypothetical protein